METVTNNQVLTQEELQTLQSIQSQTQSLINDLGEIELILFQIGERKEKAKTTLVELTQKETDFNQLLFEKYGKITLNPQTGEITPNL